MSGSRSVRLHVKPGQPPGGQDKSRDGHGRRGADHTRYAKTESEKKNSIMNEISRAPFRVFKILVHKLLRSCCTFGHLLQREILCARRVSSTLTGAVLSRPGPGAKNPTTKLSLRPPTFEQAESAWRHHFLSYWLEGLASSFSKALSRFLSWSISLAWSFTVTFSSVRNRFSNCVILRSFSATISLRP